MHIENGKGKAHKIVCKTICSSAQLFQRIRLIKINWWTGSVRSRPLQITLENIHTTCKYVKFIIIFCTQKYSFHTWDRRHDKGMRAAVAHISCVARNWLVWLTFWCQRAGAPFQYPVEFHAEHAISASPMPFYVWRMDHSRFTLMPLQSTNLFWTFGKQHWDSQHRRKKTNCYNEKEHHNKFIGLHFANHGWRARKHTRAWVWNVWSVTFAPSYRKFAKHSICVRRIIDVHFSFPA